MYHKLKRNFTYKTAIFSAFLFLSLSAFSSAPAIAFANNSKQAGSSSDDLQNTTAAKEPAAVTDTAAGIVQVVLSCVDDSGNVCYLHQGTGFLIGSREEVQYIITDRSTITPDSSELEQIRKWKGLDSNAKLTGQIQFLLAPDIAITASVVSQGSDLPYALLTPAASLTNSECLKLGSLAAVSRKDAAYLYGYNMEMSLLGLTQVSGSTPVLHSGTITSVDIDPVSVSCDIEGESGCAGAPLLDKNGHVLGMFYYTNDNLEILPADTIRTILETLNITYRSTDPSSDYNVADDTIRQELSDLLKECQQDVTEHGTEYSDKTLHNYKTAISNAMSVMDSPESTRDNYQESMDALTDSREKLKPRNFTIRIVQLIFLGVLLLIVFLNLRQLKKSKQLLYILHPGQDNSNVTVPAFPLSDNLSVSSGNPLSDSPLSKDSTGQSVHKKASASLYRTDNGKIISLNRQELRLGKAAEQVDYCITDNPAISRYHAAIVYKKNCYYIVDNHSTNHTKINGSVIPPELPVTLKHGDLISLADVDFQFHNIE